MASLSELYINKYVKSLPETWLHKLKSTEKPHKTERR
jgi:hypothetical protein